MLTVFSQLTLIYMIIQVIMNIRRIVLKGSNNRILRHPLHLLRNQFTVKLPFIVRKVKKEERWSSNSSNRMWSISNNSRRIKSFRLFRNNNNNSSNCWRLNWIHHLTFLGGILHRYRWCSRLSYQESLRRNHHWIPFRSRGCRRWHRISHMSN